MNVLQVNDSIKVNNQIIPSIDIMRIICALMVISIHINPFQEYNTTFAYICQQIIPRVAVPFFFAVSGYFLSISLFKKNDIMVVVKYLKRILFTYTLWSVIYFMTIVPSIIKGSYPIASAVKNFIKNYLLYGVYYHLWYFPALIFCVLVFAFFYKINKLKLLIYLSILLYSIGLLGVSYSKFGNAIPILNSLYDFSQFSLIRRVALTGIPFFVLGYIMYIGKAYFDRISNRKSWIISIIIALGFVLEIIAITRLGISKQIMITIFLYFLTGWILILSIKNPMKNFSKHSMNFRYIGNFAYYAHPLYILIINTVCTRIFGQTLTQTPRFFIVCVLTITTSLLISKINNKYLLKLMV